MGEGEGEREGEEEGYEEGEGRRERGRLPLLGSLPLLHPLLLPLPLPLLLPLPLPLLPQRRRTCLGCGGISLLLLFETVKQQHRQPPDHAAHNFGVVAPHTLALRRVHSSGHHIFTKQERTE